MKLRLTIASVALAVCSTVNAASYYVNNAVSGGASDVLMANADGTLLSGGVVSIGYFSGGPPSSSIDNIAGIIASFTLQHSVLCGSFSVDLGAAKPGYYQSSTLSGPEILTGSSLIGQGMYLFVGNASTLVASTAWALVKVGTIIADNPPLINQYTANAASSATSTDLIFGKIGSSGVNSTLKLVAAVPEPSIALLGVLGTLGFLRRRRN